MDLTSYTPFLSILGTLSAILGLYYSILKILREMRKARKTADDKILDEAKVHSEAIKIKLEAKISLLEVEIKTLEQNVTKEFDHVKEIQSNEIKNLADKIESLREELNQNHGHLINLLTQLVGKN